MKRYLIVLNIISNCSISSIILFLLKKIVPLIYLNNHFFQSWAPLAEKVRLVLNEYPKLKLTQGRKVLEIRPTIKWDKGKALEFLLESLGK